MTWSKGRGTEDAKEEEGGKWKLWVKDKEEDTTAAFHHKDTRIRRPFGSRCEEVGRLVVFFGATAFFTVRKSGK